MESWVYQNSTKRPIVTDVSIVVQRCDVYNTVLLYLEIGLCSVFTFLHY